MALQCDCSRVCSQVCFYIIIEDRTIKKRISQLSFYYANVTGLRSKTSQLFVSSADSCFDVICLSETWLCGKVADAELFCSDYQVFRRDRHGALLDAPVGGGVLCAVKRGVPCSVVDVAGAEGLELLVVVLRLPQRNLFVATAYVPPASSSDVYDALAAAIDGLTDTMRPTDELIIFGDFNMPSVYWVDSSDGTSLVPSYSAAPSHFPSFVDDIHSAGLAQSNAITNDSGKFLDLVFTSDYSGTLVRRCLVPLVPETEHHPSLHVVFSFEPLDVSSHHICDYSFNFKRADFSRLNELLLDFDWSCVLSECDIEKAVKLFYDSLFLCFMQCVPLCRAKGNHSNQPWMNGSLRHLKNLKSKAWRRFCSSGSDADYLAFSVYRRDFVARSEAAYREYISRIATSLYSDPRQFWKLVNSKRKTDGYPSSLRLDDVTSDEPLTVSNLFADFFSTAFSNDNCDISFKDFYHLTELPSTTLTPKDLVFDDASILKCISEIDDSFQIGPDGIPAAVIKRCCSSIVPVLSHLFNLSFHCGIFPSSWKLSVIIPLHKKGKKCDISNYRPVANLPTIAKIFEALVCDILYFHCKPFLGSFQHGFTKGKSTTTNLLEFSTYCLSALEAGKQVDCVFTDFSKAFDRINHDVLILKLTLLGFPPVFIKWLRSYLSDRSQRVWFRGAISKPIFNTSGVPQGSHLGPLLFLIYINDVYLFLSETKILCYADDAKIFRTISCEEDSLRLNSDLDAFHSWCSKNYLPLNVDKCTAMSFTRRKIPLSFNYTINGSLLAKLDKCKDLGVIFNSRFSFEDHIEGMINKASAALGFVKRWSREFENPHIAKILYCAFVRPILEYASPVWAPYQRVYIDRIEGIQRRFLKFALRNLPWRNSLHLPPYRDRLRLLSLDTLEHRRDVCKVIFAFNCLQGAINSPDLLGALNISVPPRALRSHNFLHISYHRTNYGANGPIPSMSRLFNFHFDCIDFNISKDVLKSRLS